jgi:DNA-binding NarL/FixJ family response regulator
VLARQSRAGDVPPMALANSGCLRIVIADDHAPMRMLLREELESAGFEVCGEAGTGIEAIEIALRERPDLCLLDVLMPDGDGVAAAEKIKGALPETKIVMITAVPSEEGVLAAAHAGADGYLGKDFDLPRLPEIVRAVAGGEAAYPRRLLPHILASLSGASKAR